MMDNTLEERVDRFIVKSNQRPPPNPSLRGNPAIVITMGGSHPNGTKGQKEILSPTCKNHGLIFSKI